MGDEEITFNTKFDSFPYVENYCSDEENLKYHVFHKMVHQLHIQGDRIMFS